MSFTNYKSFPPTEICTSLEHSPPSHICLPAGTHTWQCRQCGFVTVFIVHSPVQTIPNQPTCCPVAA